MKTSVLAVVLSLVATAVQAQVAIRQEGLKIVPEKPAVGAVFRFGVVENISPKSTTCLCISPDGKELAVGTPEGLVKVDLAGNKYLAGKDANVIAVTYTPSGEIAASFRVKKSRTLQWFEASKGIWGPMTQETVEITEIHFLEKGPAYLIGTTWEEAWEKVYSLAVSPSALHLAVDQYRAAFLCETSTGKVISKKEYLQKEDRRQWSDITFSPDGKKLIFGGGTEMDLASQEMKLLGNLAVYDADGTVIKFTGYRPNHNFPTWYNYLFKGEEKLYSTGPMSGGPQNLRVTGDIVAWSHFNYVFILEAKRKKPREIQTGPDWFENGVEGMVMTPDQKTIFTAGRDGSVKAWDVQNGKFVRSILEGAKKSE